MADNEIMKAFDILDKFEFFGGQRAGRELWFNKPTDIQNKDIGAFLRDLDFLKQFINRQKAEVERLENSLAISKKETRRYAAQCQTIRSETAKELAERLEETAMGKLAWDAYDEEICGFVTVDEIDNFVKEFMKIEVKNNV